jgi:ParB family chromosome partitioning protein
MSVKPAARLGKGLSALLGEARSAAPASGDRLQSPVVNMALDRLEPGPFQPRGPITDAALGELAASIRHAGVLQPLLVRSHPAGGDRFQIVAGERRWRASRLAGLAEVPVVVRRLSDAEAMAAALIENLQREDLNPVEEARGYQRLIEEFGLTHQALADALGRSRAHLSNMLRLLGLPADVLGALADGRLTTGHAKALLTAGDPAKLAQEVISKGMSVRQTEARAAAAASGDTPPATIGYADDPDTRALVAELTGRLGLRVRIDGAAGRGRVSIDFANLEQLDGIVALLMAKDA